jgi:hypothetical protein
VIRIGQGLDPPPGSARIRTNPDTWLSSMSDIRHTTNSSSIGEAFSDKMERRGRDRHPLARRIVASASDVPPAPQPLPARLSF